MDEARDVPELLHQLLLMLSGDVELNPGPKLFSVFSLDDVEVIKSELLVAVGKWQEIGAILKMRDSFLEKLKSANRTDSENLHLIIVEWLDGSCPCPTWKTIVDMLRHALVDEKELAEQLETKYIKTFSDDTSDELPHPYGCGIPDCACLPIILSLLEDTQPSLPYFDPAAPQFNPNDPDFSRSDPTLNTEAMMEKRIAEYEEISVDLQNLISYTWKSFQLKKVTVEELVEYLKSLNLYQDNEHFSHPPYSLFTPHLPAFAAAKSLEEIYVTTLSHYISVFNHEFITDMLARVKPETVRDKTWSDNYRSKFSYLAGRKVMEYPPLYSLPSRSGFAIIRVTVLRTEFHCMRLYEVESMRLRLSNIFHISKYVLKMISLTKESEEEVVYIFQVPDFTRNDLFPLSDDQINSLKSCHLQTLTCCRYKLTMPPEDISDIREKLKKDATESKAHDKLVSRQEMPRPGKLIRTPDEPPFYASLPSPSPFRVEINDVYVPSYLIELQRFHFLPGTNFVAVVPQSSDRIIFAAMLLCQHAAVRVSRRSHVKAVLVANTKPRAIEIENEMQRILPRVKVHLFTGSEEDSVTTKLCLNDDIVIVCTAGKLAMEMEMEVVRYNTISMILIDGCQRAAHHTPLEAAMHDYIRDKGYHNIKTPVPNIVGITSDPCEFSTAVDLKDMEKHLMKITAGVASDAHIIYTEDVGLEEYVQLPKLKPQPKPDMISKRFLYRDLKKDFMSHIECEMNKLEIIGDAGYPCSKFSQEYRDVIQSQLETTSSGLPLDGGGGGGDSSGMSAPSSSSMAKLAERLHVFELLNCYSKALQICLQFGCENSLAMLRESDITPPGWYLHLSSKASSPLSLTDSMKNLRAELDAMVKRKNPMVENIRNIVCKNLEHHHTSGILFVDTFKEAKFLLDQISKSHFTSRPYAVPRCLVTRYSTDTCSEVERGEIMTEEILEKGREGLDSFSKGDSRLLIIPHAIEKDRVKLENINAEVDFIARVHKYPHRREFREMDCALTLIKSHSLKSLTDIRRDFFMCLVQVGIKEQPAGIKLKDGIENATHNVMHSYKTRYLVPHYRRKKPKPKIPNIETIQLRCKKCKVFACHGLEVFSFFVDGGNHCVVPHRDFTSRFTTKVYRSKSKTIKRINRLKKMFCSNCGSPWGTICHFPAKGVQLPVIKSKHFLFEMSRKYYTVKMWSDALFVIPPVTAFPMFHMHGEGVDVDSD